MKKPFKNTKVGKFLTKRIVKDSIKTIPIIGDLAGNILDDVEGSEAGTIDKKGLPVVLVRTIILAVLLYLVYTSRISWADAEKGKDFITHSELVTGSNYPFSILNSQL